MWKSIKRLRARPVNYSQIVGHSGVFFVVYIRARLGIHHPSKTVILRKGRVIEMVNVEVKGFVGTVSQGSDKKGIPVQKGVFMTEQGKTVKVTSESITDEFSRLKSGQPVLIRMENVSMLMSEYGNLTIRCESARIAQPTAVQKAA